MSFVAQQRSCILNISPQTVSFYFPRIHKRREANGLCQYIAQLQGCYSHSSLCEWCPLLHDSRIQHEWRPLEVCNMTALNVLRWLWKMTD